jgi:hypothetical protein
LGVIANVAQQSDHGKTLRISAFALLGVAILWACGGGISDDPKATGKKFLKAYIRNDYSEAKVYASENTDHCLDYFARTAKKDETKGKSGKLTVGDFTLNGHEGTLAYQYNGKDMILKMVTEDGKWVASLGKDELSAIKDTYSFEDDRESGLKNAASSGEAGDDVADR